MNFIKKTGVCLSFVVLTVSSCRMHTDIDYPYHGSKLDKLAEHYYGVTGLATNYFVMKDTINQLQKTLATLPETPSTLSLKRGLMSIKNCNDSIYSSLNLLANNGATTQALIEGLKKDLTALQPKIIADNTALTTKITQVGSINIFLLARLNELLKACNALAVKIADCQESLNCLTINTSDAAIQTAVDALCVLMSAEKVSFDIMLATYEP